MFLAFLPHEEQNLFIFEALGALLVTECCFVNAFPPCFSIGLPGPLFLSLQGTFLFFPSFFLFFFFFVKVVSEKVIVLFIFPPCCEPAWLLLCQWYRMNGDVGKGSSWKGGGRRGELRMGAVEQ